MAVNDLYEVKLYTSFDEQIGINVLHYRVDSQIGSGATLPQFAENTEVLFASAVRALISEHARWRGVGVRGIRPLPISIEVFSSALAAFGQVTGDPLPRQTAGLITKQTGVAGRSGRGRLYCPFPGEGDNAGDALPSAGYVTRLETLRNAMLTTINAGVGVNVGAYVPVIFNRLTGFSIRINQGRANTRWATQRRRGSYGKPNVLIP